MLSGETDTEDIEKWMERQGIREEDELTVCELFDQYVRQGRAEGRMEGIAEGRIAGIAEGKMAGIAEGKMAGIAEGESRFARLMQMLLDGGKNEELKRAVSDQSYREQLYMEAGLS